MHPACVSLKRLLILDLDPRIHWQSTFSELVYSMGVTRVNPNDPSEPRFDKLSFVRYMKNIGREYREQAIKLVTICRTFVQAQKQTRNSYEELTRYAQAMPILGRV